MMIEHCKEPSSLMRYFGWSVLYEPSKQWITERKGATGRPSTHNLVSSYGGLWISVAQMVRMTSPAVMDRSGTFISLTWPFHKATRKTAGVFVRWGWGGSICQRATSWVERVGFFWRYHFSRPGNSDMAHGARRRRCVVPALAHPVCGVLPPAAGVRVAAARGSLGPSR